MQKNLAMKHVINNLLLMQQVPKPPQDEILQLEKMQEARRVLQAQALGQQKKVWLPPKAQQSSSLQLFCPC